MIVIGIDPGTAITGYAVMELVSDETVSESPQIKLIETSTVQTHKDLDMHLRLNRIYDELSEIMHRFSPDLMVIERLFFNTNAKTAMTVGQARGVPLLLAAKEKSQVIEYTALQAKQVLSGYGRATKKEMQEAVMEYLGLEEPVKPDDANDAIAMILCFVKKDYAEFIKNTN